ncbi:hypothetical protein Y1Q_0023367 [Alligator mississippiensis]|uniref:Uncharacterized protein n=1 Tax=Alligator mississippiensis TaxID=8496 RepID=A0A151NP83_ALLMI|nr:hypothetical protein Y1Q_0023367 [Alligator mississippiensis]
MSGTLKSSPLKREHAQDLGAPEIFCGDARVDLQHFLMMTIGCQGKGGKCLQDKKQLATLSSHLLWSNIIPTHVKNCKESLKAPERSESVEFLLLGGGCQARM